MKPGLVPWLIPDSTVVTSRRLGLCAAIDPPVVTPAGDAVESTGG